MVYYGAHKVDMAASISASDLPAATAFSMRAFEMAAFVPRATRSAVNGMPSLWAISFTFSWLALDSTLAVLMVAVSAWAILSAG